MTIEYRTFSEKGKRRSNQDVVRVVAGDENGRTIFILCDGMGGHFMGDIAAEFVAEHMSMNFPDDTADIDVTISRVAEELTGKYGIVEMGSTLVMACLKEDTLTVVHCGDSRCYLLDKENGLRFVTEDHTVEGQMNSPLTRCVFAGYPDKAVSNIATMKVHKGNRIFLCSDGVSSYLRPDILVARLMDDRSLDSIIDTITFLCEKQSADNYSGILIEIK